MKLPAAQTSWYLSHKSLRYISQVCYLYFQPMLFNSHILRWFSYVIKEHQLTEYCRAITGCVSRRVEDVVNDKNDVGWRV